MLSINLIKGASDIEFACQHIKSGLLSEGEFKRKVVDSAYKILRKYVDEQEHDCKQGPEDSCPICDIERIDEYESKIEDEIRGASAK